MVLAHWRIGAFGVGCWVHCGALVFPLLSVVVHDEVDSRMPGDRGDDDGGESKGEAKGEEAASFALLDKVQVLPDVKEVASNAFTILITLQEYQNNFEVLQTRNAGYEARANSSHGLQQSLSLRPLLLLLYCSVLYHVRCVQQEFCTSQFLEEDFEEFAR